MTRTAGVLAVTAGLLLAAASPGLAASMRRESCTTSFDVRGADCRLLTVPLDRSGVTPGKVHLFVERVAARKSASKSTIVLLPGGPGAAASIYGRDLLHEYGRALDDHDLLIFDQRGTGRSDYLDCDGDLSPTYYVPPGESQHQTAKAIERCARKLGARRAFYTTRDTVADLEDVRRALQIQRFVLVGVSYGTVPALAYAQAQPDHVDRIVLDSLVPGNGLDPFGLGLVRALPRFFGELCRGGGCDGITSDPLGDLQTLVARLADGPMRAKHPVRFLGCAVRPAITRSRLYDLLQRADEDPQLAAQLPIAIAKAARGRPYQLSELEANDSSYLARCILQGLLSALGLSRHSGVDDTTLELQSFSEAVEVATLCEESNLPWPRDAAFSTRRRLTEAALASTPDSAFAPLDRATVLAGSFVTFCKFWMAAPEARPLTPVTPAAVPTLIVSGLDDLRTPVEDALALARATPSSHLLLVPDMGHSVLGASGCASRAFRHFMADQAIGECHRSATHSPRPARRVKSMTQQLAEALEDLSRVPR